jgi:hypothetical protein
MVNVSTTRNWLTQLATELDPSTQLQQRLTVLTGLYLCDVLAGNGTHPQFLELGSKIADTLVHSPPDFDPETTNINQLLTSCWLLQQHQLPTGGLGEIAIEIAAELAQLSPPIPPEYAVVQLLLSRLQLAPSNIYAVNLPIDLSMPGRLGLLLASPALLGEICNYISINTLGGTKRLSPTDDENLLRQLLLPITLERLRRSELELGCMLLRALLYLDRDLNTQLDRSLAWLAAQQTNAGSYGYFASQVQQISSSPEFALGTTVSCLWTLAEWLDHDFRLFGNS